VKNKAILFLFISTVVGSANAQNKAFTFPSDEECLDNLKALKSITTVQQFSELSDLATKGALHSTLRYITGRDSVVTDLKKQFGETAFLSVLDDTKSKLDSDQISYWSGHTSYQEALASKRRDRLYDDNPNLKDRKNTLSLCGLAAVYKSRSADGYLFENMAKSSFRSARFGHFDISVEGCKVSSVVGTKSQYSEPDKWEGSQFVVIDTRFRNMDKEGRLPFEGSLIIKTPNGDELKYDTTETIMAKGYGIYFKSVNPLVTMPTKIVYRIPNDIVGEILWQPGRNSEGKRLWCAFSNPKK
jgi:hypothetical protein